MLATDNSSAIGGEPVVQERGILFSAPMVRAILAGVKTQTRRLVNMSRLLVDLPHRVSSDLPGLMPARAAEPGRHRARLNGYGAVTLSEIDLGVKPGEFDFVCPYADGRTMPSVFMNRAPWIIAVAPAQRLWVRETWQPIWAGDKQPASLAEPDGWKIGYAADGVQEYRDADLGLTRRCKPAIHMHRWMSRIVLDVIGVRIERLQEISESDAKNEGVVSFFERFPEIGRDQRITSSELARDAPYRASFACTWDEINGDRALWSTNPWVWVIEFQRVKAGR